MNRLWIRVWLLAVAVALTGCPGDDPADAGCSI